MTRDELLAKLEAYYKPLVDQRRAQEALAKQLGDQIEREWRTKEINVREYFAAQAAIVERTAAVTALQPKVDEAAALPAPK